MESQKTGTNRRRPSPMPAPSQVKLFVKPYCGWCRQAIRWLQARGVSHETLDVEANHEAMLEMIEKSGQTLAPVIEMNGAILADFDTDELAKFWTEQTADSSIYKDGS